MVHEPVSLLGHAHCPYCRESAEHRPLRVSHFLLALPWAVLAAGAGAFVLGNAGCGAAIAFGLDGSSGDLVLLVTGILGALAGFAAGAQVAIAILRRSDGLA